MKEYKCFSIGKFIFPIEMTVKLSLNVKANSEKEALNTFSDFLNKNNVEIVEIQIGIPKDLDCSKIVKLNTYLPIEESITKYLLESNTLDIAKGVRTLSRFGEDILYAVSLQQNIYEEDIMKYKRDIIRYTNFENICFHHTHKDTYVHFAPIDAIKKILSDGYLIKKDDIDCLNALGSAIYTYPLKSGMFFYQAKENYAFLIFDAEEKHYHVVQTDDSPFAIGQSDFFVDKLKIENPRIVNTYEEMEKLSKENFDWEYASMNYYGIKTEAQVTYNNFFDIVAAYNGNE